MNRQEYTQIQHRKGDKWFDVQKLLIEWQLRNNITEKCAVHHRDDTEECREYNRQHYERWGFNEDGSFEYGKYVVFMISSEHRKYHMQGNKNPMKNPEVSSKVSRALLGKSLPATTRERMSNNNATPGIAKLYRSYKRDGGALMWNDFQRALKQGDIPKPEVICD